MLNPDQRRLYTDALRPPPGFRFGEGIAATYSLDLKTLLTIPLHLALFSAEQPLEELLKDGVGLLEALRRTTDHVTIYAQASRVIAPTTPHVLYGLLEPSVVEVVAPAAGAAFHPKLWLIRFDQPDTGATRVRLLVLSRNITDDQCWDLALTLEGEPGTERREANRELAELVLRLPDLALRVPSAARVEQCRAMAELAWTADWQIPGQFDQVRFHAIGLGGSRSWLPERSTQLAVVSPFVSDAALRMLVDSTEQPFALVSRPEELAAIRPEVLGRFERVLVLAEQAETEDGEETRSPSDLEMPVYGLHAKAYLVGKRSDTHVFVGSANATSPALVHQTNVELVAELIGKRDKVGSVEDILAPDGFGAVLMNYVREEDPEPVSPEITSARESLERARRSIAAERLRIRFAEHDEQWSMELVADRPFQLPGIAAMRAWLVTRRPDTAASADPLRRGEAVPLPKAPLSLLTSFVAFELVSDVATESVRFVLNLHTENMPVAERDAAIVRDVIRNRDGFLRYVLLLLAEAGANENVFGPGAKPWTHAKGWRAADGDLPLFEHLTRAFCKEPERLQSIRRLMEDIGADGEGEVVPPEFLDLWSIFEAALHPDAVQA